MRDADLLLNPESQSVAPLSHILLSFPVSPGYMQRFSNTNAWSTPLAGVRPSASPTSSKCLQITIYDGSESPMILLRKLETLSGRIHRVAMQVRGKPFNGDGQKTMDSVIVFLLKVEFLTADAASKALATLLSKDPSLGLAEKARQVVVSALPSFALDEEDVLVDPRSLHDTIGPLRQGTASSPSEPVQRNCATEQRGTSSTTHPSSLGVLPTRKSIEIPQTSRPRSCGSEGDSYASSSVPSAGSSTGSLNSSVRNGNYIRCEDALYSSMQNPLDLNYKVTNPMSLRMADILDDYEDLALEISKFNLVTPTNDRGDAPWRHYSPNHHLELTNASASNAEPQSYLQPRETYGISRIHKGEVSPPIQRPGMSLDDFTPRTSPLSQSFGVATSPRDIRYSTSPSSPDYELQTHANAHSPPQSGMYYHPAGTVQKPQHNRGSSYSSTATSQGRHSDYQSYDSKSTSSHSSTSTPAKQRSNKKSSLDKRVYVTDPHKGPRPTDWMLSEETLKSRAARDARFMQIVAAGLAPGRTKAGWTQARRPGKRDRDAAKAKKREMEEEKERERLKQLLGEDARPSVSAAGVAC